MTRHIAPTQTRPARLAPLAKLPIFFNLADKDALIVGGSEGVAWKAELLAACGARVTVVAPEHCHELQALAAEHPDAITLVARDWSEDDLSGVAMALGDIEEEDEAVRFAEAARRIVGHVNVIDKPAFCDYQFGAIVNRSPVVIGISTDGGAPILGQAIRRRVEAVLPTRLGPWTQAAKDFRDRLKTLVPTKAGRRRFWERFVDVTFISQAEEDDRLAKLERLAIRLGGEEEDGARIGEVVIVGAGPGDPELVTLKAMREMQAADVVVYDRLVTDEVLELARREARRIHVGKKGHGDSCRQEDICALIVSLAREGHRVVRLKGGDPAIFGRTGEEVDACREAGIPVRIVPGVTTASAAAAALDVSLTDRKAAQRVQFVTGHDKEGKLPENLDLAALSDPRATTVVYMGRRTAARLAVAMLERGLPAETPAIVMTNVSLRTQSATPSSLQGLIEGDAFGDDAAPTLVMIGEALAGAQVRAETSIEALAAAS
jgi:uroporphyrin-III C-methyltransferase / precorrin-2 dehydrogenase / sirohydrochlorin ferrochelatase